MLNKFNRNMVSSLAIAAALGLVSVAHAGQSVETKGSSDMAPTMEENAAIGADSKADMDSHDGTTATQGMSSQSGGNATAADRSTASNEGTPMDGQIIWQDENTFLVSSLIGSSVYTSDGEAIGDINDVLATRDGVVDGVVIGVGGFLGLGEKDVAIEFHRIVLAEVDGEISLMLDATAEELENAPEFKTVDGQHAPASE